MYLRSASDDEGSPHSGYSCTVNGRSGWSMGNRTSTNGTLSTAARKSSGLMLMDVATVNPPADAPIAPTICGCVYLWSIRCSSTAI